MILLGMPGIPEMLIILAVVLFMFGGKKIPQLMKGIGKGIKEFRAAKEEINSALREGVNEAEQSAKLILKEPVKHEKT